MQVLKLLLQRYIQGSFHVALMVLCCYQITHFQWNLETLPRYQIFVFCLGLIAYNTIKHTAFILNKKALPSGYTGFKLFLLGCLGLCIVVFISLTPKQQLLLGICFLLCLAYAIPFPFAKHNLRNQTGVKIFIVALCWTLLTAVFPLLEHRVLTPIHIFFFLERFMWILIATLPFEISDLKEDHHQLGTIPQQLGVRNTKLLGVFLIVLLWGVLLTSPKFNTTELFAFLGMTIAYAIAFFKIQPNSSKFITLFWIEAIPLLGLLLFQIKI